MQDERSAVLLYGPPGSGKDTVTASLTSRFDAYLPFRRLKSGPGKTEGYRMIRQPQLAALARSGDLLYMNQRYRASYAVDRSSLVAVFDDGHRPVVHVGQIAGARAVSAFPAYWCRVLLWCGLATSQERCRSRGDTDTGVREQAWCETRADLLTHAAEPWSLVIDTETVSAAEAAALIDEATRSRVEPRPVDVAALVA